MKVGNVEVKREGTTVKLKLSGGSGWWMEFHRALDCAYHAELEVHDIYQGLRYGRIEMQREVMDSLAARELPGVHRGRLARAIASVREIYGL